MNFRRPLLAAVSLAALGSGMLFAPPRSEAMPQFAQATGLQCSACHTMVPLLNSYGRYVQRTAYSAIPRESLDKTFPLWIDEALNYDSSAGSGTGTPRYDGGNLAIHAIGYAAPNITYHAQQFITQGSQSGGLDTLWIAYNDLLSPNSHLFAGKVENPAPSIYSQDFDLDGPSASSTIVGEHDWGATYDNRWGTKYAFVNKGLDLEAAYLL